MIEENITYRQFAWKQFKKNKPALVSFYILILLVLLAVLSPIIANDQPLYMKYKDTSFYPAFETMFNETASGEVIENEDTINFQFQNIDWRTVQLESVCWPLIAYSPNTIDKYNRDYAHPNFPQRLKNYKGVIVELPRGLRHYLGTDKLGRDIASGLIYGTRISLLVGIISMGIAVVIGLILGAAAGYFGNDGLTLSRSQYWLTWTGVFIAYFYGFYTRSLALEQAFNDGIIQGVFSLFLSLIIAALITLTISFIGRKIAIGSFLKKEVSIPIDAIVSRIIEVLNSMPILILIISVSAIISEKSLWVLMIIIGLTGWTGIARLIRAEMLRIKQMEYIEAGKVLGFSNYRIIVKHALPNGLAPIFVSFAFGVASAILTESGLSFLGVGVPDDVVTWGSLLSRGRAEFEAWWLVIYPGVAIFITITVYNLIGEGLRDALDPKHKK
jgi:peptide/nickel transport system permease protein